MIVSKFVVIFKAVEQEASTKLVFTFSLAK